MNSKRIIFFYVNLFFMFLFIFLQAFHFKKIHPTDFSLLLQITTNIYNNSVFFSGYSQQITSSFMFAHPPLIPTLLFPFYLLSNYYGLDIVLVYHICICFCIIVLYILFLRLIDLAGAKIYIVYVSCLVGCIFILPLFWPFVYQLSDETLHYIYVYSLLIICLIIFNENSIISGICFGALLSTRTESFLFVPSIFIWLLFTKNEHYISRFIVSLVCFVSTIIGPYIFTDFSALRRAVFPSNIFDTQVGFPPVLELYFKYFNPFASISSSMYIYFSLLVIVIFALYVQKNLDLDISLSFICICYFMFIPVLHARYFMPSYFLISYVLLSRKKIAVLSFWLLTLRIFGFGLFHIILSLLVLNYAKSFSTENGSVNKLLRFLELIKQQRKKRLLSSLVLIVMMFMIRFEVVPESTIAILRDYLNLKIITALASQLPENVFIFVSSNIFLVDFIFVMLQVLVVVLIYTMFFYFITNYLILKAMIVLCLCTYLIFSPYYGQFTAPELVRKYHDVVITNIAFVNDGSIICSPNKYLLWLYKVIQLPNSKTTVVQTLDCIDSNINSATINGNLYIDEMPDMILNDKYVVMPVNGIWRVMGMQPKYLDNILVRIPNGVVYYIHNKAKYRIASLDDFIRFGFSWENVRLINDADLDYIGLDERSLYPGIGLAFLE